MLRAISLSVLFGTSSLNKQIEVAIYDEDDHDDHDDDDDDDDYDGDDYDDDINDDDDDGDGDYRAMLIVVALIMVQQW